MNQLMLGNNF